MDNDAGVKVAPQTARDALRSTIFSTKTPQSKVISFMGTQIEIRQPTLGAVAHAQEAGAGKNAIAFALISYAYIPGTDEKVFDPEDLDALLSLPFGADFLDVAKAVEELSKVNFLGQKDV